MNEGVLLEEFGEVLMKTRFVGLIVLLVFFLDQLTKTLIDQSLALKQSINIIPHVFNLTKVYNTGASFSILKGQVWFFILFAFVVIIAILYYYKKIPAHYKVYVALILGGTIGNLVDRIQYHHVIDFIDFRIWPIFNIADTAVVIGAIGLIYYIVQDK